MAEANGRIGVTEAWQLVLAVRRRIDAGPDSGPAAELGFGRVDGRWTPQDPRCADLVVDTAGAVPRQGRHRLTAAARELLELHLPLALCPARRGFAGALLGQTLDGFIATREGHSRYINGRASLVHLHRLRALSDAVVIGVGTAIADGPRLTTRHVPGPDPVRVVIDPHGRLPAESGLLRDGAAPTLVIRAGSGRPLEERLSDQATVLHLPSRDGRIEPAAIVTALAGRGLGRLLVEGGGFTVSRFLEAGLLDRLQLAISPVILGAGRPALPVTPAERLDQALRPSGRRFLMGEDVLFDLCLRSREAGQHRPRSC
ncbi:RibD family protein [Benzoatithermus flavus]|uniref:RibD family protein n=1 Tax=Benzoatithermus flavus TaxID=3108223 RepID=A0ABU8XVF7_9PROT